MLSIVYITLNAQAHLARSLASLELLGDVPREIIVVDGASTDQTQAIAASYGARLHIHADWPGFGAQKNRALGYAMGDWVLVLDADEVLTAPLAQAICAAMKRNQSAAYRCARLSSYCGTWIHHSGWRPDYVTRLFPRGTARFSDDLVHERLLVNDVPLLILSGDLLHYAFSSQEEILRKLNQYSSAGAQMRYARKESGSLSKALVKSWFTFFRTYIFQAGFLDGRAGLMLAISNAHGVYYRTLKLAALGRTPVAKAPSGGSASS